MLLLGYFVIVIIRCSNLSIWMFLKREEQCAQFQVVVVLGGFNINPTFCVVAQSQKKWNGEWWDGKSGMVDTSKVVVFT